MIVYLSIGNSDDKLTQAEWSQFYVRTAAEVASYADRIHGAWFSHPCVPYQNACWCLEFDDTPQYKLARDAMIDLRREFRQDSAAWATATTEFI